MFQSPNLQGIICQTVADRARGAGAGSRATITVAGVASAVSSRECECAPHAHTCSLGAMASQERLERKLVELAIEAGESDGTQKWAFLRDVLRQVAPTLQAYPASLRVRVATGAAGGGMKGSCGWAWIAVSEVVAMAHACPVCWSRGV